MASPEEEFFRIPEAALLLVVLLLPMTLFDDGDLRETRDELEEFRSFIKTPFFILMPSSLQRNPSRGNYILRLLQYNTAGMDYS
jgi:hypothetical protein